MTSIYLAGKIGKSDWREDVVPTLTDAWGGYRWSQANWEMTDAGWPVIPTGVLGALDYTGPYFTESCTHSDAGCPQPEHRMGTICEGDGGSSRNTVRLCLDAIDRSDIVFAWLTDTTAFGTIAEIGYARGKGKRLVIAAPRVPVSHSDMWDDAHRGTGPGLADLWFTFSLSSQVVQAPTPRAALQKIIHGTPRLDSPIEVAFWEAYLSILPAELFGLETQCSALDGRYRIDFALPEKKIGIELDGYAWHSSREAFTKDRERQRNLELNGWRIIRFSGSEIKNDAAACVRQAACLVQGFEAARV